MSSPIQPATDEQVRRLAIAAQMGADPTSEELLSLIARIEADRERLDSLTGLLRANGSPRFNEAMRRLEAAEAREKALRDALAALVANHDYSALDKGIGTATLEGVRWLNARALSPTQARGGE